jgi:hypothetical protein
MYMGLCRPSDTNPEYMRCSGPDLDRPRFGVVGETHPEFVVDSSTVGGAGVGQHPNDVPELLDEVTNLDRCHALVLGPDAELAL